MRQGNPPTPPLDTMLLFERGDESNGNPITHEVLSLIHQEKGKNSYPWTIFSSLETHHEIGDGCVHCARLHKFGPGWAVGLHSEVYTHARGVALGANIEMTNDYVGSDEQTVIGLNIQAVAGPTPMQHGIQIHDSGAKGAHFQTAIHLKGMSTTGIDLSGKFGTGIHLHNNPLKLSEGTPIQLDDAGKIQIRYKNGKIEFLNDGKIFFHLDTSAADHTA
ncbi:MAG TPA: hypothetical protein VFE58_02280 [Tepidisphaeraceae bacterium]|nr:hypothetical protein [Tepidisphaeraceae bacterium]